MFRYALPVLCIVSLDLVHAGAQPKTIVDFHNPLRNDRGSAFTPGGKLL